MADGRFSCGSQRDGVILDTNRVLDCCRDRDCYENVEVFLSPIGEEIIQNTDSVRIRDAEVVWTSIDVVPIQFNRGFCSVNIRYFVKITAETCMGGRAQDFDGIAVLDKDVVLYGGESCVSTFTSDPNAGACAGSQLIPGTRNKPTASVDVADPVVLGARVTRHCDCDHRHCIDDVPESVLTCLSSGGFGPHHNERELVVSLGIFSVIRLTRPGQYLVNATEYTVPDKECFEPRDNDPCSMFRKMAFPVGEFSVNAIQPTPPLKEGNDRRNNCGCSGNN